MFGGAGDLPLWALSPMHWAAGRRLLVAIAVFVDCRFCSGIIFWLAARTYKADMEKVADEKLMSA
jgi:hypothetical protein